MPELPEVETIRRDLAAHVIGLAIERVEILDGRVVRHAALNDFVRRIKGQTITRVDRKGKAVIVELGESKGFLVIQPMMTGQVVWVPAGSASPVNRATKAVFQLSKGNSILYNDQRLFGRLQWVEDLNTIPYIRTLGPDPVEGQLTTDWVKKYISRRSAPIKSLLLDQHFIAGIGNIYASEILFACGIDPRKPAGRLSRQHIDALCTNTVAVLVEAVKFRGTSMRNYRDGFGQEGKFKNRIRVYARAGEACRRCETLIEKIVQTGRSTFFCPKCQK